MRRQLEVNKVHFRIDSVNNAFRNKYSLANNPYVDSVVENLCVIVT
jgi:hypothetical protein